MRRAWLIVPLSLSLAATALALPPGAGSRGFRDGANGPDLDRLDSFSRGAEHLYVYHRSGDEADAVYDADGDRLTRDDAQWFAAPCGWPARRKRIAHAGKLGALHAMIATGSYVRPDTDDATDLASGLVTPSAAVLGTPAAPHPVAAPPAAAKPAVDAESGAEVGDLPSLLAANMLWYVEWPHIDRRFIRLFKTIPGYWPGQPNGSARPEAERAETDFIVRPAD